MAVKTAKRKKSCCCASNKENAGGTLGRPFDDIREAGAISDSGHTYARQKTMIPNVDFFPVYEDTVFFSSEIEQPIVYAIMSVDKLQPSHIGKARNPLHFIPEAQPRNRAEGESGSAQQYAIAENLKPALVMQNPSAYAGAPIVNKRGEVIQGNGRAAALKIFWKGDHDKEYVKAVSEGEYPAFLSSGSVKHKEYLKALRRLASTSEESIDYSGLPAPVLVRIADVTDEEAIKLGQYQSKDMEAVSSAKTDMKAKINRVSEDTVKKIVKNLLGYDDGEKTLNEIIRAGGAIKILIKEGVLRPEDAELYADRSGAINTKGIEFVMSFLLNYVFSEDLTAADKLDRIPHHARKSIEKALLYIISVPEPVSLRKEIGKAIPAITSLIASGLPINTWKRQTSAFEPAPERLYDPLALKIAQVFAEAKNQTDITKMFGEYSRAVAGKPADMFGPATPGLNKKEAVKKVFGVDIAEKTAEKNGGNLDLEIEISRAKAKAAKTKLNLISTGLNGYSINDEMGGIELRFDKKPSAQTLAKIKELGFRWSPKQKIWWAKGNEKRLKFAQSIQEQETGARGTAQKGYAPAQKNNPAEKLSALADSMQKSIDAKMNPAVAQQNNTHRRTIIIENMYADGEFLIKIQTVLRGLAKLWQEEQEEDIPETLINVRTITDVKRVLTKYSASYLEPLDPRAVDRYAELHKKERAALIALGLDSVEKLKQARNLMLAMLPETAESSVEKKIQKMERDLVGQKIDGFFPTPNALAMRIIDNADIRPGESILEPSAGKGDLAERIREAYPNNSLKVIERNYRLGEILKLKRFDVLPEDDFLAHDGKYDAIVMNPPFENGQDIDHVKHAYGLLKPGGRVSAIMSMSVVSNTTKKYADFRSWYRGKKYDLVAVEGEAFKGKDSFRQTGVRTITMLLEKETDAPVQDDVFELEIEIARSKARAAKTKLNLTTT